MAYTSLPIMSANQPGPTFVGGAGTNASGPNVAPPKAFSLWDFLKNHQKAIGGGLLGMGQQMMTPAQPPQAMTPVQMMPSQPWQPNLGMGQNMFGRAY